MNKREKIFALQLCSKEQNLRNKVLPQTQSNWQGQKAKKRGEKKGAGRNSEGSFNSCVVERNPKPDSKADGQKMQN